MVHVRDNYPRFREARGDVTVITMGTIEQTAAFRERNRLPFMCLSDSKRVAYEAFGVPRGGVRQVAGPAVWASGLRATLRAGIGKPVGDIFQLHGTFIVDPTNIIRYQHLPSHSADQPTDDQLIEELKKL